VIPCLGERLLSEYSELFNDAAAAADLVDDFGSTFFAETGPGCNQSPFPPKFTKLSSLIPSLPPKPSQLNVVPSSNTPKTMKDAKRHYRQTVAIPRYLAKRKRRRWDKELMHPSRSAAAHRRKRNGGQFDVTAARFLPVSFPDCP